jgi:AGCS family alanine or glycine:cation symporter
MQQIADWNSWLNGYVWGWPMIILLVGTGVLLTLLTGVAQFRYLGRALSEVLGKITQKSKGDGSVTPFQAVSTALASTVGVGNIAGVATAIGIGGPGAPNTPKSPSPCITARRTRRARCAGARCIS